MGLLVETGSRSRMIRRQKLKSHLFDVVDLSSVHLSKEAGEDGTFVTFEFDNFESGEAVRLRFDTADDFRKMVREYLAAGGTL